MKTASKTAVTTVILMSVAGCGHKTKAVPPPQAQAPVGPPSGMTYSPSMPSIPPPPVREATIQTAQEPSSTHTSAPKRPPRHKPSPSKPVVNDPASAQSVDKSGSSTVQTASGAPAEGSPIGQLSSTGESVSLQGRHEIEQLISTTESGLNNIKRSLSSEEQVTSTQIKTFLTKAKQALADNDLDGAQTLAVKAKVLLDELTKK